MTKLKNKTLVVWLGLVGGIIGLDHFYLYGWRSFVAWLKILLSALGIWGLFRMFTLGTEDGWGLILTAVGTWGFALACSFALYFGLHDKTQWLARFAAPDNETLSAAQSNGITILGVSLALALGMTSFLIGLSLFTEYFWS